MPRPTRPDAQPKPKQPSATNGAGNDDVARRAYEIYESRGGVHGSDLDHWLEAERELKSRVGRVTAPTRGRQPKAPRAEA